MKKYRMTKLFFLLIITYSTPLLSAQTVSSKVDYEAFLEHHDMLWDEIPNRWELAPYSGNGNVGFLFYRTESEGKNIMSIYTGRHDYYDHREGVDKNNQMLWIYSSRLPLGHFNLESKGEIIGVDLRLSLWNAELAGTIKTSEGSYHVKGYSHSNHDVIYFETIAKEGENIKITWHPEDPIPPVWQTLQKGGGPKGGGWDKMRNAPMTMPPKYTLSEENGINYCFQPLYKNRGETTTAWTVSGTESGVQQLLTSIHHSFPEHNSKQTVTQNLKKANILLKKKTFESAHKEWWHAYYPLSFLTINDPEKEGFYWIQMYKFASATRGDGPIMDLMGPWYHKTFWPMVWGDLNVQLQYWTPLTANHLSVGESLPNWIDKHATNLEKNVPDHWKNSAAIAALFPQDLIAYNGGKVPDMLAWLLHNYWLHCQFAGDNDRMREQLYPLLRKTMNAYLNYLNDNPTESLDGKIHIKNSWSPEYPNGYGEDINFTIALMRWTAQTLIDINNKHNLNDSLLPEWQNIVTNLVEFQTDDYGLRIGKNIAFETPHRHYSHLLGFYPLAVITADNETDKKMLRTTLDHWLDVSINSDIKVTAMPVTGYTATGAASMYAALGDAEKAYYYLNFLIQHKNISSTTMYAEGNPVIESPLSFATSVHDMLLQSMGGIIKVFLGTPERWSDASFYNLRAQGAFLVSGKRKEGKTQFVSIESLVGSPCIIQPNIEKPLIYINGKEARSRVTKTINGYSIDLKKGDIAMFTAIPLHKTDLTIEAIPVSKDNRNLFGFSHKTERLPGHNFYKKR